MWSLAWNTLRSRIGGFTGAFVALLCAAAVITACGAVLETGLHGRIAPQRYADVPIVVSGDQQVHHTTVTHKGDKTKVKTKSKTMPQRAWIPDDLADTVAAVPGVSEVVEDRSFPAVLLRDGDVAPQPADAPIWGHGWESASLAPFRTTDGAAPARADQIALDARLADTAGLTVGDTVDVQTGLGTGTYTVTGIAETEAGTAPAGQSAVFFNTDEAERLADHPGQVTALGVRCADGADPETVAADVATVLDGAAVVATGDDRGAIEYLDAEQARISLISVGGAMAGTCLLVAILVVVGTFALQLRQRFREIALLRAVAATPRQIRAMIGGEALIVGAVAGGIGAAAGLGLASVLHRLFVTVGAIPPVLPLVRGPLPALAAVLVTMAAAWTSARVAGRRTARIAPTAALGEAVVEPRVTAGRIVAALLCLAGFAALLGLLTILDAEPAAMPVTFLTVVAGAVAVALWGPILVRGAAAVGRAGLRLTGVAGWLAGENGTASARRTAAIVTPLSLLIAMTGTILFLPGTLDAAASRQASDGLRADLVVRSSGVGVPDDTAEQLSTVDGVSAVTGVVNGTVRIGLTKYRAQGLTPDGLSDNLDPDVTDGTITDLSDDGVALSRAAADDLSLSVGDPVTVHLPDTTDAELTVVAVYARGLGFGDVITSYPVMSSHVDKRSADAVYLSVTGDPDVAADRVTAALADHPELRVDRTGAAETSVGTGNPEVNLVVLGLVIAFALIAVVNTAAMSVGDRGREFALLRLIGVTARQVRRMIRWEMLVVAGLSAVLGTAVCLLTVTAFSVGMTGSAAPVIPIRTLLGILVASGAITLAAAAVPARAALRASPAVIGTRG